MPITISSLRVTWRLRGRLAADQHRRSSSRMLRNDIIRFASEADRTAAGVR